MECFRAGKQSGSSTLRRVMGEKGFLLAETLVAAAILATTVAAYLSFCVALKRNLRTTDYDYVAINLCRDALAYAAGNTFMPTSTLRCAASGRGSGLLSSSSGEGAYNSSDCDLMFPGTNLKTAGLVPKGAPDSVVVTVSVERLASMDNAPNISVTVQWQDSGDSVVRERSLSTIPLFTVNDQLRLRVSKFSWV